MYGSLYEVAYSSNFVSDDSEQLIVAKLEYILSSGKGLTGHLLLTQENELSAVKIQGPLSALTGVTDTLTGLNLAEKLPSNWTLSITPESLTRLLSGKAIKKS